MANKEKSTSKPKPVEPEIVEEVSGKQVDPGHTLSLIKHHQANTTKTDIVLTDDIIRKVKTNLQKFEEFRKEILTKHDVQKFDGHPYIKKSGWRKLGQALNLSVYAPIEKMKKIWGSDDMGKYYTWLSEVTVFAPNGRYIVRCGSCSSRDSFFAKAHGLWRKTHEVDEKDVINKCITNAINCAISDLVGMGEVSYEELEGKDSKGHVTFPKKDKPKITTDQLNELRAIFKQKGLKEDDSKALKSLEKYGVRKIENLTKENAQKIIDLLKPSE